MGTHATDLVRLPFRCKTRFRVFPFRPSNLGLFGSSLQTAARVKKISRHFIIFWEYPWNSEKISSKFDKISLKKNFFSRAAVWSELPKRPRLLGRKGNTRKRVLQRKGYRKGRKASKGSNELGWLSVVACQEDKTTECHTEEPEKSTRVLLQNSMGFHSVHY